MNPVTTNRDLTTTRPLTFICWIVAALLLAMPPVALAQDEPAPTSDIEDTRTQYPVLLRNSYFSLNLGYIDYGFSARQLEPGFSAESIDIPRVAVRAVLIGHQFTPYFSVQAHYARPVQYVSYRNVNGEQAGHHVWMHFGGVTAKSQVPLSDRIAVYGEAGIGLT